MANVPYPEGKSPAALSSSPPGVKFVNLPEETRDRSGSGTATGAGFNAARRRTSSFGSYTRVVVVAVDGSEHARNAFDWYLNNIWRADDLLILVHCPEAPRLPTFSFKSGIAPPVEEWKKILDDMNSKARRLEEDYEGTCTQKKLKFKVRCEAMKNIGEGICRIADEELGDLIICGSRGTGGTKFALKGPVCEYLMRNSPIPTVIVPLKN